MIVIRMNSNAMIPKLVSNKNTCVITEMIVLTEKMKEIARVSDYKQF